MNFREKVDNILKVSHKKYLSIQDLEVAAGLGMNTLRKAYNDNREPSRKVVGKLLEGIGISEQWYETGKGEVFLTPVPQPAIKEKEPDERVRLLILNLDRMGETNAYLLKRIKELGG